MLICDTAALIGGAKARYAIGLERQDASAVTQRQQLTASFDQVEVCVF
jgi:hypothetical protein